ncbi:MAG: hypothetical protein Q7K65_03850 [Candidatus Buchananbacteria bacterium]|nr:hypothetical protein [Candidatus Buchananbacteria bacterium]
MATITHVDEYVLIAFEHVNGSALIYIEEKINLTFFQIDMLENFFQRMMFYCGPETNIDINIQRLKDEEVNITGYFYNKNQDYDFCGTFESVFIAIHNALSDLFDLSVNNQEAYRSVNSDMGFVYSQSDETEDSDVAEGQGVDKSEKEKLTKLGQVIDEMFKNDDDDEEDDSQPWH